jgi:c(7)-type cytochrome triheme protein
VRDLGKTFSRVLLICFLILCVAAIGVAYAQKKVGGGDIKYDKPGMPGPVTFSHESHVNQQKAKCADCHPKVFKMKKGENNITQASFKEGKYCGACHNGQKAFSATAQADCNKCHKK